MKENLTKYGKPRCGTKVIITCSQCGAKRWKPLWDAASDIKKGKFTGLCRPCSYLIRNPNVSYIGPGRRLERSSGYVFVTEKAITPSDRELYDVMRLHKVGTPVTPVKEHRFVMAKVLERPLRSDEIVHHLNGNRSDNAPENLRLFARKGHHKGYGSFYHEWQLALSEIARLKRRLKQRRSKR